MKKKRYIITFIAALIILNFFFIAQIRNAPLTFSVGPKDNSTLTNKKVIELTVKQSKEGYNAEISKGNLLKIPIDGKKISLQLINTNTEKDAALFKILYPEQDILLTIGETKKLDLNREGKYKLSLTLKSIDDNVKIQVQTIDENIGTTSLIENQFKETIEKLQTSSKRQLYLIIFNLVIIILGIIIYLLITYLPPKLKMKKIEERETPSDILVILIKELKKAIKKKNKEKVNSTRKRIKHLYKYMDKEERKKIKTKIDDIEKYIN